MNDLTVSKTKPAVEAVKMVKVNKTVKAVSAYQGIPKRVRVGSVWIKIVVGDNDNHEIDGTFGHFSQLQGLISLRPTMNSQQLANTFIHECIHAMNAFSRAGNGLDDPRELEEDFTCKIANGLCTFWQDNPAACAWWVRVNSLSSGEAK